MTNGLVRFTSEGVAAEFVRGLICAVLAGVAFFSGLACFLWAEVRQPAVALPDDADRSADQGDLSPTARSQVHSITAATRSPGRARAPV